MNIIYLLIGISVFLALLFLIAFFWAVKTGQNDDTYTPGVRILFEEELPQQNDEKSDEDHL